MKSVGILTLWRALLTALVAAPLFAHAAATVLIDGAAYPAELRENADLLSRVHGARSSQARHYEGELTGVADSWVRVSNIRGHWAGIVALDGNRFIIDSGAQRDKHGDVVLTAQSPNDLMTSASCATEAPATSNATLAAELSSGTANADFAAVCQTKVNGVCLLAELDIAFDLLFQQRFPATYQDQAAAIMNMVDGYYRNDLSIQFDVLSMTFLSSNLFSTTTNSSDLLTDISNKKDAGLVPFVTNSRAILHLTTGRDFDGSTIGIANVGSLCSTTHNTGTAQIVQNSIPLTALVTTHEIGHNFGADHDGSPANTCAPSGNIMAASLSATATHFSQCSIDAITTEINSQSNLSACFEFPVDAVLTAHAGNPTTADANENFTLDYDISETHASVASAELRASGSFGAAGGTFVAATINGAACSVASDAQSYLCVTGSSGGLLEVTARAAGGTTLSIGASVAVGPGGGAKDIDSSNNSAGQTVATLVAPPAPSALAASAATAAINLTWQDNSATEDGFRVERRTGTAAFAQIATTPANASAYSDTTAATGVAYDYRVAAFGPGGTSSPSAIASAQIAAAPPPPPPPVSSGGGGGGGSFGAELAPLLLALVLRRRRSSAA
jgi:hypothetical protein